MPWPQKEKNAEITKPGLPFFVFGLLLRLPFNLNRPMRWPHAYSFL